jgi:ElaA protein
VNEHSEAEHHGEAGIHTAIPSELSLAQAYPILRLRVDVFVVEQDCPYPELDGRDLEPGTRWVWTTDAAGAVIATLRMLSDPDGRARIGRVATAPAARSNGTASRLMAHALRLLGDDATVTLDAQAQLEGWYARFGFARSGQPFVEDGIPHVPMDRPAHRPAADPA